MFVASLVVSVCLSLPANATVADPFRKPSCERCAGNRGVELIVSEGDVLRAGLDAEVSFSGQVGGVLYVVLRARQDPNLRVTYGGLREITVPTMHTVRRGDAIGVVGERLHLGLRRGDQYLDPLSVAIGSPSTSVVREASQPPPARPRYRVTLGRARSVCGSR